MARVPSLLSNSRLSAQKDRVWLIVLSSFAAVNLLLLLRHFGQCGVADLPLSLLPSLPEGVVVDAAHKGSDQEALVSPSSSPPPSPPPTNNSIEILPSSPIPTHWISTKVNNLTKDIRIFIPAYKNADKLESLLQSIYDSDIKQYTFEVYVINNFGHGSIPPKLANHVDKSLFLIDNTVRPDFSTGHLARDWNTGLVQGFRDLDQPISKIVVLAQGDTKLKPDFASKLHDFHFNKGIEFLQDGRGDEFQSFLPQAVKRVGLYDERFCGIGYQEEDYFVRATLEYLDEPDKIALLDFHHGRVFGTVRDLKLLADDRPPAGNDRFDEDHWRSRHHSHPFSHTLLQAKWPGLELWSQLRNTSKTVVRASPALPSFVIYPYFEMKILNLDKKGFIVPVNYRDV